MAKLMVQKEDWHHLVDAVSQHIIQHSIVAQDSVIKSVNCLDGQIDQVASSQGIYKNKDRIRVDGSKEMRINCGMGSWTIGDVEQLISLQAHTQKCCEDL